MGRAPDRNFAANSCASCWRFWCLPSACVSPSGFSCGLTICFPFRLRICDMRSLTLYSALFMLLTAGSALAQVDSSGNGNTVPQLQNPAEETIEIGLSTETIAITSNFGGTGLTIFGALDNADPMIQ